METLAINNKRDFSIIFKEIENFNLNNPSFSDNLIKNEDLEQDESIRVLGEMCQEINSASNTPTFYTTFS